MKNILLIMSIYLLFSMITFSQKDSSIYTRNVDISYYSILNYKYQGSNEIRQENQQKNISDVTKFTFISDDSVYIYGEGRQKAYINLKDIDRVYSYREKVNPFIITSAGAILGGVVGALIGSGSAESNYFEPLKKFNSGLGGFLIGALAGGVISYLIAGTINEKSMDLFSIPYKDKKSKLIKFLKEK